MDLVLAEGSDSTPRPPAAPFWRVIHTVEDVLLAAVLAGVVLVPIADMVLRSLERFSYYARDKGWFDLPFHFSLPGANVATQTLTMLIGIVGGVVAARELRLISLTKGFPHARAPWAAIFEIVRAGMSIGVSAMLCWAALGYMLSDYGLADSSTPILERFSAAWTFLKGDAPGQGTIAFGIPHWVPLVALVAGFLIIGVRLLIHVRLPNWRVRLFAVALAAVLVVIVLREPFESSVPLLLMFAVLVASVVFGAPIFVLLGGAAVFLFWNSGEGFETIALSHTLLSNNPTIPALPLFTLAGYFLAEGGTSKRMFRLLRSLVGGLHSGPALVTVLACAFFTSLTGASGVTVLALGGLLVPFLVEARYPERGALGFFTCSASVGMLFAPCLPLIFYAIIAHVEIKAMFLGGIGPGILFVVATVVWGTIRRPRAAADAPQWKFDAGEALAAAWDAKWELLIPVVSLGGIFSGLATPVEAAAVTALFAFVIETFLYRDLKLASLLGVMRECGMLMGGVLLMLGVAQGFTDYLINAQIPDALVTLATSHISSKLVFLLLLNFVLLLVGCVMEIFQAIIVVAPLLAPIGAAFGINPVHLGILFLANLELGFMMPPVGMNLLLAAFRFKKSMTDVLRAVAPYLWPQLIVVLLVSYWPALSEWLPKVFGY